MLTLDHIVLATADLVQGTETLEDMFGTKLAPGGKHAAMGTHNRLLSLGPDCYLELIAVDPDAPPLDQPRWYALDGFSGLTRLTHWAARCDNLDAALVDAPVGTGSPWDLARGTLRWRMAIPRTGQTPFGGLFPALLQWQCPHPAPHLPDRGFRLTRLTLHSPQAAALRDSLRGVAATSDLRIEDSVTESLSACISGPDGEIAL